MIPIHPSRAAGFHWSVAKRAEHLSRMFIRIGAIGVAALTISSQQAFAAPTALPVGQFVDSGIASTYGTGDGFQGRLTACGQVFDTNAVQVAHKTLPCGTMVRVEDVDTGASVVARVTDRGPYVAGRVVDLSWAAFKQLDPVGPGLLNVKVYLMPTAEEMVAANLLACTCDVGAQ